MGWCVGGGNMAFGIFVQFLLVPRGYGDSIAVIHMLVPFSSPEVPEHWMKIVMRADLPGCPTGSQRSLTPERLE
jgi:hypothetical protein